DDHITDEHDADTAHREHQDVKQNDEQANQTDHSTQQDDTATNQQSTANQNKDDASVSKALDAIDDFVSDTTDDHQASHDV
ncbi:hypothetical protein Q0M59_19545, partial [Staphylococcus aureus]|nr:hypothetical protein [Staphylococcus aureus]